VKKRNESKGSRIWTKGIEEKQRKKFRNGIEVEIEKK